LGISIGGSVRILVVKYMFRRKLHFSLGFGPDLDKPRTGSLNTIVSDKRRVGAGEDLNEKMTGSKRRYLRIWVSTLFHCRMKLLTTGKTTDKDCRMVVVMPPFWT